MKRYFELLTILALLIQQEKPNLELKTVDYQPAVRDCNVNELKNDGIECLSGKFINRGDRRFVVVSVLLTEKVYCNLSVKNYPYIKLDLKNFGKPKTSFKCISTPVWLMNNDIGNQAYFGLLKFEAEVLVDNTKLNQAKNVFFGEVNLPLSALTTTVPVRRDFAVFATKDIKAKESPPSRQNN